MNSGWIKLYRKLLGNEIWFDETASRVFIWLLLMVDKETGKIKIGRKWASKACELKEMTFYKALHRLQKRFKIVNLVTDKLTLKFTEIEIKNWKKYQGNNNPSNNPVTIDAGTKAIFSNNRRRHKGYFSVTTPVTGKMKLKTKFGNNPSNNQITIKEQSSNNQVTHNKNRELRINITTEKKIVDFLKTQEKIKNPEGYLTWIKQNYGIVHLKELLSIEFPNWIEHLKYWRKNDTRGTKKNQGNACKRGD